MTKNTEFESERNPSADERIRKHLIFYKAVLVLLVLAVLWLYFNVTSSTPDNIAYMPNQDNQYTTIKTDYGSFPVSISGIKNTADRTELTLIIINPLNVHFADAKVSVHVFDTVETVTTNLKPSANNIKFKTAPIERGHLLKVSLELDRIFFK